MINVESRVSAEAYLAELPSLVDGIDAGTIGLRGNAVPLPTWRLSKGLAAAPTRTPPPTPG